MGAPTNQTSNRDTHPALHANMNELGITSTHIYESGAHSKKQEALSSEVGENSSK